MSTEQTKKSIRQARVPPTFQQLCVIVREQIQAEPTIDDGEWKARVKDRLIALGFTYPQEMDGIERSMRAVTRALERTWGPRPAPLPPTTFGSRGEHLAQVDPPWRRQRSTSQEWTSLRSLLTNLKPSKTSASS